MLSLSPLGPVPTFEVTEAFTVEKGAAFLARLFRILPLSLTFRRAVAAASRGRASELCPWNVSILVPVGKKGLNLDRRHFFLPSRSVLILCNAKPGLLGDFFFQFAILVIRDFEPNI